VTRAYSLYLKLAQETSGAAERYSADEVRDLYVRVIAKFQVRALCLVCCSVVWCGAVCWCVVCYVVSCVVLLCCCVMWCAVSCVLCYVVLCCVMLRFVLCFAVL
jgi:hypothetical protein